MKMLLQHTIGSYVLYPGNGNYEVNVKNDGEFGYGVGAFSLNPNEYNFDELLHLKDFIKEIIENEI